MKTYYEPARINPLYAMRMTVLKEIAKELDVVLFLPNYHAEPRDGGTIMLYTKEANDYNSTLPSIAFNEDYAPSFFCGSSPCTYGKVDFSLFYGHYVNQKTFKELLKADIQKSLDEFHLELPDQGMTVLERLQKQIDYCNSLKGCNNRCSLNQQNKCELLRKHKKRMKYCTDNDIPIEQW